MVSLFLVVSRSRLYKEGKIMRLYLSVCIVIQISTSMHSTSISETWNIVLKPIWRELQGACAPFHEKWVFVGTATFRTKLIEPIQLNKLTFAWHGATFEHLSSSLYRTDINESFLATDQYWVADGAWIKSKQQIIYKFPPKTLASITHFHLVFTVPLTLEINELPPPYHDMVTCPRLNCLP
jgi:hypothetical protein